MLLGTSEGKRKGWKLRFGEQAKIDDFGQRSPAMVKGLSDSTSDKIPSLLQSLPPLCS